MDMIVFKSKLARYLLSSWIERAIKKKLGLDAGVAIESFELSNDGDEYLITTTTMIKVKESEVMKLIGKS